MPASSGDLDLMIDTLEMNGGTCHKSDLAFLVACRATRPAVDALLRSERDFVPLGYEAARDKLMRHGRADLRVCGGVPGRGAIG